MKEIGSRYELLRNRFLATAAALTLAVGTLATSSGKVEAQDSPVFDISGQFNGPRGDGYTSDYAKCARAAFQSVFENFSIGQNAKTKKGDTKFAFGEADFTTIIDPTYVYGSNDEILYCVGRKRVRTSLNVGLNGKQPRQLPYAGADVTSAGGQEPGSFSRQKGIEFSYKQLCNDESGRPPVISISEAVTYMQDGVAATHRSTEQLGNLSCNGQVIFSRG